MNSYSPKVILVTGGAGFIGSNFIRYVLATEPDINIINLDKLTYAGSLENLENISTNKHHFIKGDICDADLIHHVLQSYTIDTIINFAAESHVDRSITKPAHFVETNLTGTFTLLEVARKNWLDSERRSLKACRFHHISTDEVFGSLSTDAHPFTETHPYQPRSPYSSTKAGADHLVNAYFHTYGLPITISHCSNNYGPYQHDEKFIPTIIRSCLQWQAIPIYGVGKNVRDWLFVKDHCDAIMAIIKRGKMGESYNIGGNNEWENLKLAHFICEKMDKLLQRHKSHSSLIEYVKDRPGHDFRYAIDTQKIKHELGWIPYESFESGLTKTIDFYIKKFQ